MKILIPEQLKDLMPGYLARRLEDLQLLYSYQREKKYYHMKPLIHKIVGSAGCYGLDELSTIAKKIERDLDENNFENIYNDLLHIETYIISIDIEYTGETK